ncbi:hypothetical protein PVL29_019382 [Vitis rotundifolia]|uniref:Disease resistance protein RGA3 n=1 Tax=Vitis rotundifolia TaxID=103349 RepID=A0AA39DDI8_VITRO|nr:hypothetical protein PVL29_019382 [Vitis rotundifolia]
MADLAVSLLVTPIVDMAIKKALSLISEEFHAINGVKKDIEKLQGTLRTIKNVLKDAEEKQLTNRSLKDWLGKLEDAAYDTEDILDAFSTEVHLWNRKQPVPGQPPFSVSKFSFQRDIAGKIKKILTRLDEIDHDSKQFQLLHNDSVPETQNRAPQTGFFVDSTTVVGREDDKNKMVELLLSGDLDKEGEISVIPIIGMGGLGKTTLAQLVYNDERVKECFEFKMWVSVNIDFDLSRILKDIIEYHTEMKYDLNLSLSLLESRFLEFLAGKKFLLVLDNVWNDDYMKWEPLKNILKQGGRGSKVLITSRTSKVSAIMGTQDPYRLDSLPEEKCWLLFQKIAFEQCNLSSERRGELESIGRNIIRKCQFLPLAVKVMAGLLRGNDDVRKWQMILRSDIWDAEGDNPTIFPALKLSYDQLSSHLKQCYAFCSIFPKAYIFDKKELVKFWVAEGFIQESGQETGTECFDKLLMRSFFQVLNVDNKERYRMHDLIHDLARHVSLPYCCQVEDANISDPFNFRHASLLCKDVEQPLIKLINTSKRLRTLLFHKEHLKDLKLQALDNMFHTMTYIRVLDLSSSTILELPQSIEKLKLLRYLDLSKTEIRRLPDSLCNLYNLQTLKLLGCLWLFELPRDLRKLINLQHLELDDMFWHKITRLPPGMGKLTSLQNLHAFHTGSEKGFGIEELKDMVYLAGTLHISKLENAANAREAKLNQKESLDKLVLEWSNRDADPEDQAAEETVLEDLQPHSNLEELQICHYRGTRLPVWMRDGLLQKLVTVSLKHCTKCKVLSLGRLPHLRQLCIKGMQELEDWPEVEFPSLDTLKISNCPKLRKLHSFFPILRVLNIKKCDSLKALAVTPSLRFLILVNNLVLEDWQEISGTVLNSRNQPIGRMHSYQHLLELKIISCPKLPSLPRIFAPQKLEISGCELLTALPVPELSQRLQHLELEDCRDGTLVEAIPATSSLYSLVISNISNITSLPILPHLPGLKALYIRNCKDLVSLSQQAAPLQDLTFLKLLSIQSCPELVSLTAEGLSITLECLMIGSCPNLESLGPMDVLKRLTSLKDLYIEDCPKLKCLPEEGVPASLEHLVIQGCPLLMEQCRKEGGGGPDWLKVKDIPDLEIDSIDDTLGLPHESSKPRPSSSARWYHHLACCKGQTSKGKKVVGDPSTSE